MPICPFIGLSVYWRRPVPICPFIGLSVYRRRPVPICPFIGLSVYRRRPVPICPFIGLSAQAGADLSVYRFIGLSAQAGKNRPCHHAVYLLIIYMSDWLFHEWVLKHFKTWKKNNDDMERFPACAAPFGVGKLIFAVFFTLQNFSRTMKWIGIPLCLRLVYFW